MTENLHVAAVDLGATNIRTGLIRRDGTVIAFRAEEVPKNSCADGSVITERIAAMITSMTKETGITPNAIGISSRTGKPEGRVRRRVAEHELFGNFSPRSTCKPLSHSGGDAL